MNRNRLMTYTARACALGITLDDARALLRASRTLSRWAELECGTDRGHIERDEATGKPRFVAAGHSGTACRGYAVRDMEAGAIRRVDRIVGKYPDLLWYHQTDPRGCAVYVLRRAEVDGQDVHQVYHRGLAVCS